MISMHAALVPPATASLQAMAGVLAKGLAFAEAHKIDPAVLLGSRLRPDMFPLTRQVQIACDIAKGGCARLAGQEAPSFPDTEASFEELQARIVRTTDYMAGFAPSDIDGSEERPIVLKMRGQEIGFSGLGYLTRFVLPNVYFHTTTAYLILRHNGVDIGKRDYLGAADR